MASTQGIRAGRAFVGLFVDDSKLVRGLRRAEKRLKAFGDRIRNMGLKIAGLGAAVLAPLAGAAKYFSSYGDQVAKMARRTGMSVEALSEMQFVASQTGTELSALEGAFRRMQRSIYDAGRGLSTACDALEDLGLTYKDLDGLSPEEQFKLLADKIGQVQDPTKKAAIAMSLFGRAGTALLPMFEAGAAGITALQKKARELGLTMSKEDAKAAEEFTDAMDSLWKVVKMGVFHIGSALAPVLQQVAETMTGVTVKISGWIKNNRELIVTVLKVAAAVVAGGIALVVLGTIISSLGTMLGVLISTVTAAAAMFQAFGVAIAFLVSPIGMVIAALGVLGAYLIYTTDAGGKALGWLGDKFTALKNDAIKAFGGISDALAAGDIGLAAEILWGTLKLWWVKGTESLRRIWIDFKAGFVKIFAEAFYGGLKVARKVWEWLEIGWAETTAFFSKAWYGFVGFFQKTWERIKSGAQKAWNWIKSLFDDSIDLEAENKLVEQEKQKAIAGIENEQQRKLAEREAERQADRQKIDKEANAFYERQDKNKRLLQEAADQIANEENAALTKRLASLRKERDDAIAAARQKRRDKDDDQGPGRLDGPEGDIIDQVENALAGINIGDAIAKQAKKIGVKGTFNASALRGLQAGNAADRTAKASEETAKNTKKLVQSAQSGGLAFA
ncbi:MAG: phage tail tape measure protein [Phycisphaerae bacterium]|nr:phage tail tape measure protein [Phycisphaerae bacterium]